MSDLEADTDHKRVALWQIKRQCNVDGEGDQRLGHVVHVHDECTDATTL